MEGSTLLGTGRGTGAGLNMITTGTAAGIGIMTVGMITTRIMTATATGIITTISIE
jgi:hypothetical protein